MAKNMLLELEAENIHCRMDGEGLFKESQQRGLMIFLLVFLFVLFCFVLFCFVLFCFVLFCFPFFSLTFSFQGFQWKQQNHISLKR